MQALGLSLLLAVISTLICLIVAFPMAMALRESKYGKQGFLIFVIILPMWMNFLLRTMAWQVLLERQGVINAIISAIGLPRQEMMNTPGAIVLGMVYDFLPFMILPIYNTVSKIDNHIIEAAYDLGAGKSKVFTSVILPLSVPGIVSGITGAYHLCDIQHAWRRKDKPYRKYNRAGIHGQFQLVSWIGAVPCDDGIYNSKHAGITAF